MDNLLEAICGISLGFVIIVVVFIPFLVYACLVAASEADDAAGRG